MKAAVLTSLNKPLQLYQDVEIPPLKRGQVLVKLAFSGVCHSQLMEARGLRGEDRWLPHMLGHEGSGRVEKIGNDVTKIGVGDNVILGWIKGEGIDTGGVMYKHSNKVINAGSVTTFNEFAIVSENRLVQCPRGIPMDVAVLFGCAIPTGAGIVINELDPEPEASIAVFGLGGIGLSALMAAKTFKPSALIAIDVSNEKLKLAQGIGATHTLNATKGQIVNELEKIVPGGVDYCVEASGKSEVIEIAFQATRKNGGLCIFASHPKQGSTIKIDPYDLICGKQIRGSWGGASKPDKDIPVLAKLYRDGHLPLEKLISKRYKLNDINDAINDLENNKIGRPIIEIDPSICNKK